MATGKFIVFEGPDGSGQTTQVNLLKEALEKKGLDVVATKEPTENSPVSRKIHSILKHEIESSPQKLQELFVEDRRHHVQNFILPNLEKSKIVISDRYFLSTLAYGSLSCDLGWLTTLNQNFPNPNITFILDVNPEICIERIIKRGKAAQFFETKKKLTRIMENYRNLAPKFKNTRLINGEGSIKEVHQKIVEIVSKIL